MQHPRDIATHDQWAGAISAHYLAKVLNLKKQLLYVEKGEMYWPKDQVEIAAQMFNKLSSEEVEAIAGLTMSEFLTTFVDMENFREDIFHFKPEDKDYPAYALQPKIKEVLEKYDRAYDAVYETSRFIKSSGWAKKELNHSKIAGGIVFFIAKNEEHEVDFTSIKKIPALMREMVAERCAKLLAPHQIENSLRQHIILHYEDCLQILEVKRTLDEHADYIYEKSKPYIDAFIIEERNGNSKQQKIQTAKESIEFPAKENGQSDFIVNEKGEAQKQR